jgi:hypothetical protein
MTVPPVELPQLLETELEWSCFVRKKGLPDTPADVWDRAHLMASVSDAEAHGEQRIIPSYA